MADDEPSGTRPAPVVLRIKLRYDDVEGLVARFAPNVGKSGLFLPTKSLQPLGAEVKFELRLTTDAPVLVGLGRVRAATPPDPAHPRATFGIALELMRVTPPSKAVILRLLERRKQLGLPEIAVPLAADVDAARRAEAETGAREAPVAIAPPPERDSHPVLEAPLPGASSAPVLTAPRGSVAVAKSTAVAALAPEAPRRPRPLVHEVIERASGPVTLAAEAPDLDDLAVGVVVARARDLATGPLDPDLAALRDSGAAPFEITIEAASAELARQLGGMAVARDRSVRWARPPATVSVAPAEALKAAEVEALALLDAPDDAPVLAPELAVEAEEVLRLGDADVEEVEHTQIGMMPEPAELRAMFTARPDPAAERELEQQLEAQLAAAEADDDEDLGFEAAAAAIAQAVAAQLSTTGDDFVIPLSGSDIVIPLSGADLVFPPVEPPSEIDDAEILAEADAGDADLLAGHAPDAGVDPAVDEAPYYEPPADLDRPPLDDADELGALGAYEDPPLTLDPDAFGSLDLGRDSVGRDSIVELRVRQVAYVDAPLHLSSEALGDGVEDLRDEATSFATPDFLASFGGPPSAHAPQVMAHEPEPRDSASDALAGFADEESVLDPGALYTTPIELLEEASVVPGGAFDLESALDALDVDLDDLSMPHAKTELPSSTLRRTLPAQRSSSASIDIDLDDD